MQTKLAHPKFEFSALDSAMPPDSIFKISILPKVSLAEQSGLSLAWSNNLKMTINGTDIANSERGSSVESMSSLYASNPKTNLLRSAHVFVETFLPIPLMQDVTGK